MFLPLLFTLVIVILFYNYYWKRRNLPPGPPPLPLFGNILDFILKPVYEAPLEWHKKYGPIHTIWFSEFPIVAISDIKILNETFVKDADSYVGRLAPPETVTQNFGGQYGIINTEGHLWLDQRRFTLHVFRDFGMGKNLMQEKILDEVMCLIEKVINDLKNDLQEINLASHIDVAVGSIINNLLFNYRFDEDHIDQFHTLKRLITEFNQNAGNPLLTVFRGYSKYIPFAKDSYYKVTNSRIALYGFYRSQIEEHQKRIDHDSEPSDYVDAFLREKARRDAEREEHYYTMIQLLNTLGDLWMAGQETTSNTLAWGVIYLMLEQKAQEKLQEELDRVVGNDRLITLEDKPKLQYTQAVVNEIQRIANLGIIIPPHATTKDVIIEGYSLKKGTIIIPHISAMLYDEKVFPDPTKFKPERFLDLNGNIKKIDEFIPFSTGKRQCLGEGLARMELFLLTANIFNQFRIKPVPSNPPSLERKFGGTINAKPFVCQVEKRY